MKTEIQGAIAIARDQGRHMRIFDRRYCTGGDPNNIFVDGDFVVFGPGSYEVIETGSVNGPPRKWEPLRYMRWVAMQSIIQMELCESPTRK
jgi:hypothetical protein